MTKLWILAPALLAMAPAAAAQTPAVNAARTAGVVGERFDGYLGITASAAPLVRREVANINIRRRALYSNLATSRGATLQEVGITAGCQLLSRVAVGEAYMLHDGVWRRRLAGQAAPRPSYCG